MLALALASVIGCSSAAPAASSDTGTTNDALEGGEFTFVRPEIGRVDFNTGTFCTATLIAPRVVVTAAHCVEWESVDGGYYGYFTVQQSDSNETYYDIEAYTSWGEQGHGGKDDVALVRLSTPVPSNLARPAKIATRKPSGGTDVTIFGYGCGVRPDASGHYPDTDPASGRKQKRSFELDSIWWICPGDSGGPTAVDSSGDIFRVSSWLYWGWFFPHEDEFGDLVKHKGDIENEIASWGL